MPVTMPVPSLITARRAARSRLCCSLSGWLFFTGLYFIIDQRRYERYAGAGLKSLYRLAANGIIRSNGVKISGKETVSDAGKNRSAMRHGVTSRGLQYVPSFFPHAAFWPGPAQ